MSNENMLICMIIALFALVMGGLIGFSAATSAIASDCHRLGGFSAGNKVFDCRERAK